MRTATKREGRLIWGSAEARSLLWRIASMILLFNGLLVAWVLLKPGSDALVGLVVNTAEFVGPLLVLPLCFGGLLRWRGWRRGVSQPSVEPAVTIGQRWAPILLGLGILSWIFGQALFTFYEWALRDAPPLPSLADVGYLSVYAFLLLGILLLPSRPVPVASRTRIALDGLMIMTAAVTFSWYFVLGPIMQQGNETTLAKAVSTAYPLADIVLIVCLVILAARPGEHALRPAVRLLALGLILIVVADTNFAYWSLHDTYATGTLPDVGWSLGYMLVALGAFAARLAPSGEAATTPDEPGDTLRSASTLAEQRVWASLLPYILVPAVGILVVYAWRTSTGSDSLAAGVYIGGALLIGLVLLRQVFNIVENARLYNRLLAYVRNVDRVTDAAAAVEAGEFDPGTIAQVAARRDELGRLARVFQQMAREVRAREQRLKRHRAVVDAALDAIVTMSADGLIRSFNHSAEFIFGYTAEEAIGQRLEMLMPERYRKLHKAGLRRYLNTGEPHAIGQPRLELAGRRKDGTEFPLELSISETRERENILFIGIVRDITERKRAEEALKQSEQLYRTVIEQAAENICLVDAETKRILESNPAFQKTLGYTEEELRHMTLYDIVAHDRASVDRNMRRVRERKHYYEGERKYRRKDGSLVDVEASGGMILLDGRESLCIVAHDITERARVQELLEERVATLSGIAASLTLDLPVGDTLDVLAEGVVNASTAVATLVILTGEETDMLRPAGSHGLPESFTAGLQAAYSTGAQSPTLEAFRRRRPMLVRDFRRFVLDQPLYAPIHHFVREAPWDTLYIVPLISRGRALGTINLCYLPEQEPSEDEKVFLGAVADQTAVAVENARLLSEARGKAALEERQRLARELHDSVSQALYGITLGTKTARTLLDKNPDRVADPLDYVLSLAEAGQAEMRALIFELRPESLETEGLIAALEKQAAALKARHEIEVDAVLCDEPEASLEAKEVVYRIAQEALHNTVKHARAANVQIKVACDSKWITLEVSDDGIGFDALGDFPGHLGLRSMRERALHLGGTLEVDSTSGKGTRICAQIPI
jgi:PAS domain S-box-containing protein